MNKTNFNQTGGFPLKTERLQELQTAFDSFNSFGELAGNLTIISGCETVGTTVKAGRVYINGELYDFREASGVDANSQVIIIDENVDRAFENGTVKTVHVIRYATIGTAETSWPWSSFVRPPNQKAISAALSGLEADKAEQTDLVVLQNQVTNLQNALAALQVPKIIIDSDRRTVNQYQGGNNYDNLTRNYIYVYPPSGYTMANLAGFIASISQIKFAGDVDDNDGVWCKHAYDSSKITVICGASEMREVSQVSYMAVWIKYN